jgi:HSP20 family protein
MITRPATRWDPVREYATLQDRMNHLLRQQHSPEGPEETLTATKFAPPVDVYEDEHNITLKIEVPGIDQKDIDVHIQNNTLTVYGERKLEKEEKEENFRRVERHYGSFTRSFTVLDSVDPEQISAHYDKGVLKIILAKKAEAKPKRIKVNVSGEKILEAKATRAAYNQSLGMRRNVAGRPSPPAAYWPGDEGCVRVTALHKSVVDAG